MRDCEYKPGDVVITGVDTENRMRYIAGEVALAVSDGWGGWLYLVSCYDGETHEFSPDQMKILPTLNSEKCARELESLLSRENHV